MGDALDSTRLERIAEAKEQDDRPKLLARLRATEEENAKMHAEIMGLRRSDADRKLAHEAMQRELIRSSEHLEDFRRLIRLLERC